MEDGEGGGDCEPCREPSIRSMGASLQWPQRAERVACGATQRLTAERVQWSPSQSVCTWKEDKQPDRIGQR